MVVNRPQLVKQGYGAAINAKYRVYDGENLATVEIWRRGYEPVDTLVEYVYACGYHDDIFLAANQRLKMR